MENFIITMTYLFAGMGIKKIRQFPKETGSVLNLFAIYLSLPALILIKIPGLNFHQNLLATALIPWATLIFSAALILLAAKICKWEKASTGCLLLLVPLGNTAFFGVPMVKAFFGENATSYALLYDQLGTFICFSTYGSFIIALYGKNTKKPTFKNIIEKIIFFPPFIAFVAALALKKIGYPVIVLEILNSLADTLIPVVMVAVGYQLSLYLTRETVSKLAAGLFLKLILVPVTVLFVCFFFGLKGEAIVVSIFQSGMPPMVTAGALAIMADLNPPLAAALVGAGIILSFATLPILYKFIYLLF